eukprot:4260216-Prorocentrum_lima.AAC.1
MVPKIIAALLSPANRFGIQPIADPTGVYIYSLPAALAGPILDTVRSEGHTAWTPYRLLTGTR